MGPRAGRFVRRSVKVTRRTLQPWPAPIPEQNGSPLGPVNRTPPVPDLEIPTFRASGSDPSSWIKAGDKPLTFRTSGQRKDVTLVPLNSLYDRRYSVYWEVS